ncbi:MAG TPA: TIR domain-containing protein [Blastocatellia bacterium]|nr:TIR domain-containing protein [Blastocatellia bacterium]
MAKGKDTSTEVQEKNEFKLPGLKLLRTLQGHSAPIRTMTVTPDGGSIISGSDNGTMRVWDIQSGQLLRTLKGYAGAIYSVAVTPDGGSIISGSDNGTMRVWDMQSGQLLRTLEGHVDAVLSVAVTPNGLSIISGSSDRTVRMWDIQSGQTRFTLRGHKGIINSVVVTPDGRSIISLSDDRSFRFWDFTSHRLLRTFEGLTSFPFGLAVSPDGKWVATVLGDEVIRLWNLATENMISIPRTEDSTKLLYHPSDKHIAICKTQPILVTVKRRARGGDQILIWEADFSVLAGKQTKEEIAHYRNAKVLLVGDTGVGKSGLTERLVHKYFTPTISSHARKAHILESKVVKGLSGISLQEETVLWDLAGQPAYRLVHQLSMEDAALACVLFDSHNETNPFEGASYWSQVLDQARTNTKLKKILVAARIDVGGLPASKERIEAFAREHGFAQFIPTSARTGEGCDELMEAIRQGIAWDEMPKVTTTGALATLRDYVAYLKGERSGAYEQKAVPAKLLSIAELHKGFVTHSGKQIPLDEFITHLRRLEATDTIALLVFHTTGAEPRPEDMVLLDPTRVDAYASALLMAAKDEPDGPGHLLESRVRKGDFRLAQTERIAYSESERHVLWYVIENLLTRDLALREQIKDEDYIVFPSQCTAELRFPGAAAFGVAFGFAGPVRSIYATLIAQLAHYEEFKKREFFQDAAAYRPDAGGRCLVRLCDHGHGQGELEVSFDKETPANVRQGFIKFVSKHLEAKSNVGSVTSRHAYHCKACLYAFEDKVVKARLDARRKGLSCPICEKKTPLVNLLAAPTADSESVAAQIAKDAKAGRQRMTAKLVIKAKESEGKFDVFLSHNSKDKAAVEKIAKRLLAVGIRPWLDKWHLSPGDTVSDILERAIKTIPCAALFFGPADIGKWHIMEVRTYVEKWASDDARMIPVILPGIDETPELPLFVRQTLWVDMRDWEKDKDDGFYRLVCGILGKAPGDSPMKRFGVRDVAEWQGRDY